MGTLSHKEAAMTDICSICANTEFEYTYVERVFDNAEGHPVLIKGIPTRLCTRCDEAVFSLETIQHLERLLAGNATPIKFAPVYEYS